MKCKGNKQKELCYKDKAFYLWDGQELKPLPGAGPCKKSKR